MILQSSQHTLMARGNLGQCLLELPGGEGVAEAREQLRQVMNAFDAHHPTIAAGHPVRVEYQTLLDSALAVLDLKGGS